MSTGQRSSRFPLEIALETFGSVPGNSQNIKQLFSLADAIVPFVGAGLSADFELPLWGQLIRDLARDAGLKDEVEPHLRSLDYERAFDVLAQARPRLTEDAIRMRLDITQFRRPLDRGAVRQLPRIARGPVITSNFDRLIECAFEDAGVPFSSVLCGTASVSAASRSLQLGERFLLKLHGDVLVPESRIVTLEEYHQAYGDTDPSRFKRNLPVPALLDQILSRAPLLFLGCSLRSDRTVRVVGEVARRLKGTVHFALLSSKEATKQRVTQLEQEFNIRPIFFPDGNFRSIESLLCLLAESISEKEGTKIDHNVVPANPQKQPQALARLLKEQRVRRGLTRNQLAALLAQPEELVAAWEDAHIEPSSELISSIEKNLITGSSHAVEEWFLHLQRWGQPCEPNPLRVLRRMANGEGICVESAGVYQGLGQTHHPPRRQLLIGSDAKLHINLPWPGYITVINVERVETITRSFFCLDAILDTEDRIPAGASYLPKATKVLPVGGPPGWNCAVLIATRNRRFQWDPDRQVSFELSPVQVMAATERLLCLPPLEWFVSVFEYEVISSRD